jgi:hypothetical protein
MHQWVSAPADAPAGSTVMIWVNQAGRHADSPLQHSQVTGRTVMVEILTVTVLAVVLIIAGWRPAGRWTGVGWPRGTPSGWRPGPGGAPGDKTPATGG